MILKVGQNVLSEIEKAIYSYNHIIENLNLKCEEAVEDILGNKSNILDVRCVGSNPLNKNNENNTVYTSEWLQNHPTVNYSPGDFNGIGKSGDNNCSEDLQQMFKASIEKSDNSQGYWLASRLTEEYDGTQFNTRYVDSNGGDGTVSVWNVIYGSIPNNWSEGIRPVITVTSGILDNAPGSGTASDPYIIQ